MTNLKDGMSYSNYMQLYTSVKEEGPGAGSIQVVASDSELTLTLPLVCICLVMQRRLQLLHLGKDVQQSRDATFRVTEKCVVAHRERMHGEHCQDCTWLTIVTDHTTLTFASCLLLFSGGANLGGADLYKNLSNYFVRHLTEVRLVS